MWGIHPCVMVQRPESNAMRGSWSALNQFPPTFSTCDGLLQGCIFDLTVGGQRDWGLPQTVHVRAGDGWLWLWWLWWVNNPQTGRCFIKCFECWSCLSVVHAMCKPTEHMAFSCLCQGFLCDLVAEVYTTHPTVSDWSTVERAWSHCLNKERSVGSGEWNPEVCLSESWGGLQRSPARPTGLWTIWFTMLTESFKIWNIDQGPCLPTEVWVNIIDMRHNSELSQNAFEHMRWRPTMWPKWSQKPVKPYGVVAGLQDYRFAECIIIVFICFLCLSRYRCW